MEDRILGSDDSPSKFEKVLGSDGEAITATEITVESSHNEQKLSTLKDRIVASTRNGPLAKVPDNFEDKAGDWVTVNSENLFEVLFLDYNQYEKITPEVVLTNFQILTDFWKEKDRILIGGAREKIKAKYGEDTVVNSFKRLQFAFDQLKTNEGVQLYYQQVEKKRYNLGLAEISDLIELSFSDGEFTKREANKIISIGIANGLFENEVRQHLLNLLKAGDFKPRSTKPSNDPFDNRWMTDEKWKEAQLRTSIIFGTTVSSLEDVGEVLYKNEEKAHNFLKNTNYIIPEVTKLHSTDKAFEFEEILEKEHDQSKRYLKAIYHLNPSLPYRINGEGEFKSITDIYKKAFDSYIFYKFFSEIYEEGKISIWLKETDPNNYGKLPVGTDYKAFLEFTYKVNKDYPFYLIKEKIDTPQTLISNARADYIYWKKIIDYTKNGQLPIWFSGIGRQDWVTAYNSSIGVMLDGMYQEDEDKELASVQTLIQIIDETAPTPALIVSRQKIEKLDIEGSDATVKEPLTIQLQNTGFARANIYFDTVIEGIDISVNTYSFHSQNSKTGVDVELLIDSSKLIKKQLYQTDVIIETLYEKINVPVKVMAVFPKKAYAFMLLKYAAIFMLFFGLLRYGMGELTANASWLGNNPQLHSYLSFATPKENLPVNSFYFFLFLLTWVGGLVGSIFVVRKFERI